MRCDESVVVDTPEAREPMPIRAVSFDWGGVLTGPAVADVRTIESTLGYAHRQMVEWMFHTGLPPDEPGAVVEDDFALLEKNCITAGEFRDRVLARSADHLGAAMNLETFNRIWALFEVDANIKVVNWPMVHFARRLRAQGVRTAILTNQIVSWREFWRSSVPVEEFDVVVDSCEVGLRKPEAEIMQLTCKLLGVQPQECVHLDDSKRNIAGAHAVGMEAILVDPLDPMAAIVATEELLMRARPSSLAHREWL